MKSYARQKGTIISVAYDDDGSFTAWVVVSFKGSQQAFGGMVLGDIDTVKAYIQDICKVFGVEEDRELIGKECYVLRCWDDYQANIEGLESLSGDRFTATAWRKKMFPKGSLDSPLEAKRKSLLSNIASLKTRLADCKKELATLEARYIDWEMPNPCSSNES